MPDEKLTEVLLAVNEVRSAVKAAVDANKESQREMKEDITSLEDEVWPKGEAPSMKATIAMLEQRLSQQEGKTDSLRSSIEENRAATRAAFMKIVVTVVAGLITAGIIGVFAILWSNGGHPTT